MARPQTRATTDDDDADSHRANVRRITEEVDRAVREEEEGARAPKPKSAQEEEDEGVEVSLDDDEDDEPAQQATQPSRSDKRQNRYREQQERAEAAERRTRELEANLQTERLRADSLALMTRQPTQPQGPDPLDMQLKQAQDERHQYYDWFVRLSPEEQAAKQTEAIEKLRVLDNRATEIITRRVMRDTAGPRQAQPTQADIILQGHYPDVVAHPSGNRLTKNMFDRMLIDGKPDNAQTLHEAAAQAREALKTTGTPRREERSRDNLREKVGFSPSGSGPRTTPGGRRVVTLSKAERRMAVRSYPHLPEREAYTTFARRIYQDGDPE